MFSKRLLASITIDKKKLKVEERNSCVIQVAPISDYLTKTEFENLKEHLNNATDIARRGYVRKLNSKRRK